MNTTAAFGRRRGPLSGVGDKALLSPGEGPAGDAAHIAIAERLEKQYAGQRGVPALAHAEDRRVEITGKTCVMLAELGKRPVDGTRDVHLPVLVTRAHIQHERLCGLPLFVGRIDVQGQVRVRPHVFDHPVEQRVAPPETAPTGELNQLFDRIARDQETVRTN